MGHRTQPRRLSGPGTGRFAIVATMSGTPANSHLATTRPELAIIGGSGFYAFFDDAADVRHVEVDTPYGPPSGTITVGTVAGRTVAFLPRHGVGHRFPAHKVPYRANLWALRSIGVRQVIGPCAVGSLVSRYDPGTLVVPDQLVDRTYGRVQTFYDEGAVHVFAADPYCPRGRATAIASAREYGWDPVERGTLVVIEGPRFSTRAESQWYAAQGWTIVGMTGQPEAILARELAMCYTPLAMVTDLDAGVAEGEGVTQAEVLEVFAANIDRLRGLLEVLIANLSIERDCPCPHVLEGMPLPFQLPG